MLKFFIFKSPVWLFWTHCLLASHWGLEFFSKFFHPTIPSSSLSDSTLPANNHLPTQKNWFGSAAGQKKVFETSVVTNWYNLVMIFDYLAERENSDPSVWGIHLMITPIIMNGLGIRQSNEIFLATWLNHWFVWHPKQRSIPFHRFTKMVSCSNLKTK